MMPQPADRFKAWRDKRQFTVIAGEIGYWTGFWLWKNGPLPQNNVVNIKEAACG